MIEEPDNLVLQLLRGIRADLAATKAEFKADMHSLGAELKSDMHSLHADVASDLLGLQAEINKTRKELGEQIAGLRKTVVGYHSSVIGHGVLISEQEERIRRIELHLDLPSLGGH